MNGLLTAIGAMAELSYTFFKSVKSAGATDDEAFGLTKAFISATFGQAYNADEHPTV